MITKANAFDGAMQSALALRRTLEFDDNSPIGVILGTGWGDKLELQNARELPMAEMNAFKTGLDELAGHSRKYVYGRCEGVPVLALSGRIHLNERPADPDLQRMVRQQVECMILIGAKKVVLTCAAGSLKDYVKVGSVVIIDGFVSTFLGDRPLFAGEFCCADDVLSPQMISVAEKLGSSYSGGVAVGGHVYYRGPNFEGRKYDKPLLRQTGATVVGMSVLPEALVCATYKHVKVLALAFVTNDDVEEHSHETNLDRAQKMGPELSRYLRSIICYI